MMKIACISIEVQSIEKSYLIECIQKTSFLNLRGTFESAEEMLEFLRFENIDLIFADITIPDIRALASLNSQKDQPYIIFVTPNPETEVKNHGIDVSDYIAKPINYDRFLMAVAEVQHRIYRGLTPVSKPEKDFVTIKDGYKYIIIRYDEIIYIEGSKEYVSIVTAENSIVFRKSLILMEGLLPKERFLRVQKSYIVNTDYIREVTATKIIMKGDFPELPVGRQFRKELFRRFGLE